MAIAFTKVSLPYGWLGNMSPHSVQYCNLEWRTTEALFQALRLHPDNPVRELIRAEKSPMAAKMVARQHHEQRVIVPMSRADLRNMGTVLQLKLAQHQDLEASLLATGDEEIIEDCTRRANESGLFWGAALQDGKWVGQNCLGKLWMAIRTKLRTT